MRKCPATCCTGVLPLPDSWRAAWIITGFVDRVTGCRASQHLPVSLDTHGTFSQARLCCGACRGGIAWGVHAWQGARRFWFWSGARGGCRSRDCLVPVAETRSLSLFQQQLPLAGPGMQHCMMQPLSHGVHCTKPLRSTHCLHVGAFLSCGTALQRCALWELRAPALLCVTDSAPVVCSLAWPIHHVLG